MTYPDRIYHWLDGQLSIARHYGGLRLGNDEYRIAYEEEGQPLVKVPKPVKKPKKQKPQQPGFPGFT
jgi:hypothetical protein